MIYSTVRVVAFKGTTQIGTGTGFYYRVDINADRVAVFVVTNKHVLEGADSVVFAVHLADASNAAKPSSKFEMCQVTFDGGVLPHPTPSVDLVAISIVPLGDALTNSGRRPFILTMSKENIPGADAWNDFGALETVKMVGCPRGLFDEAHALPLIRQGITASQLSVDFQGRPEFVVDMACFPGSSGSPIFLQDEFGYHNSKTNAFVMGANRFFLVGVLFAGPLIQNDGTITLGRTASFSVASMMHLGYAIKSSELLAFDQIVHEQVAKSND